MKSLSNIIILAAAATSNNLSNAPGIDLTVQSLYFIIQGLACWASRFAIVIMVIMIVWYGIQFMLAQGNESKFTEARKSLTYAVVGILIILGAYSIIATVGNAIAGANAAPGAGSWVNFTPLNCTPY